MGSGVDAVQHGCENDIVVGSAEAEQLALGISILRCAAEARDAIAQPEMMDLGRFRDLAVEGQLNLLGAGVDVHISREPDLGKHAPLFPDAVLFAVAQRAGFARLHGRAVRLDVARDPVGVRSAKREADLAGDLAHVAVAEALRDRRDPWCELVEIVAQGGSSGTRRSPFQKISLSSTGGSGANSSGKLSGSSTTCRS